MKKIEDMARFHERESDRERRLIAVLLDRTGTPPLAGSTSVKRFQRTTQGLNKVVHGSAPYDADQAEHTWSECVTLLRLLFLPDVRYRELERLASVKQPSADDVQNVGELVIAPPHLRYFLARVERPVWLDLLTDSGLLDPPDDGEGWPVFVATERLARRHPAVVAKWLNKMYARLSGNARCVSMIGDAALAIGDSGLPLVARIVRRHSSEADVVRLSWDAARSANPSSESFDTFMDIVLNQHSSSFAWTFGEIAERFVSGMDASNAMGRLQLLVSKIGSTPGDDLVRSWHEHKPYGSIADRYDEQYEERLDVLIQGLMRGIRTALKWVGVSSLLDLMDTLPGMIGVRMRLWFLGNTPEVSVGTLIDEISGALEQRRPNGDDLAVIDRVVQMADPALYETRWREAIGPAPAIEKVGRALAADEPREEWIRAFYWFPLLAGVSVGAWEDALAVLSAYFGTWSRELLEHREELAEGELVLVGSPFSVDELASLSPEDACHRISGWRPKQGAWRVSAHSLSLTLERVVISRASEWVRRPFRIAMALRHPTYIHRYLVAVRTTISDGVAPVDELIRLVSLLRTHPWKADQLGTRTFEYDTGWDSVDRATIDLIEKLAKEDIGFAGLSNEVWKILESAVRSRPNEVAVPAARDPVNVAINKPHTQALGAALQFVAYEYRSTNRIRADAFRLLDETLHLGGDDGLYHRAMIAPYVGLLRQVAPEWMETNRDLLFGSLAPTGLGQKTVDQVLKWGQTNKWLMETLRDSVMDAVSRRVKHALDCYLTAMLWDWDGYSLEEAAKFLAKKPELLSAAGHRLGSLLDTDSAKQAHIERAIRLWEVMIETRQSVEGLAGFGGFVRATVLDDRQWSLLTLKTLKRTGGCIDEPNVVAERAAGLVPDDTTLEIMDTLVRRSSSRHQSDGRRDPAYYRAKWHQGIVEKAAVELLERSSNLSGSDQYQRLQTALRERGADI
ncbi:MAG: hypothetical protein OXH96_09765 [Spirochaetaceae bacterium]|nr:hypothetical protein [Spirochaetaceae bacterium]